MNYSIIYMMIKHQNIQEYLIKSYFSYIFPILGSLYPEFVLLWLIIMIAITVNVDVWLKTHMYVLIHII